MPVPKKQDEPIGLTYVGDGAFIAGWPASDHNETDKDVAAQKLASGLYTQASGPFVAVPEPPAPPEPEPEPAPPPRAPFWWEEVSPEAVAKARAVLEAAERQSNPEPAPPAEPKGD